MASDSRQHIVEILKRRNQASVTELSQALGLTAVTIRHHLDTLMADGIVSEPVPRRRPGPGRPEMVYGLTPRADGLTPRNFGELCGCLLQAAGASAAGSLALLQQAGGALGAGAKRPGTHSSLNSVVEFLDDRGYFPAIEESEKGQVIVLANCPYLEVARANPQVCQFDVALLQAMLGGTVLVQSSIARWERNCRFALLPEGAV